MTNSTVINAIDEVYSTILDKNNSVVENTDNAKEQYPDKLLHYELIKKVNVAYDVIIDNENSWECMDNKSENVDSIEKVTSEGISTESTATENTANEDINQSSNTESDNAELKKIFNANYSSRKVINYLEDNIDNNAIIEACIIYIETLTDKELVFKSIKLLKGNKKFQRRLINELWKYQEAAEYVYKSLEYVDDIDNQHELIKDLSKYQRVPHYVYKAFKYVEDEDNQYHLIKELCRYQNASEYVYKSLEYVKGKDNQYHLVKELSKYQRALGYVIKAFKYVDDEDNQLLLAKDLKAYQRNTKGSILSILEFVNYAEVRKILIEDFLSYKSISDSMLKDALEVIHEPQYQEKIKNRLK